MLKRGTVFLSVALLLSACGTFSLGKVTPQPGKTADQQQLDTLTCKNEADLAGHATDKQIEEFLMGLTLVLYPAGVALDRRTQREAFSSCMQGKGYTVIPAS